MNGIFVYEYLSGGGEMAGEAGELLAMGQSMRDAIATDLLALENYHVSVATCKLASAPPATARPVTAQDGESALHFVQRQADAHEFAWVVAPETDGLLGKLQQCVAPGRWLGCDGAAIEVATRKGTTLTTLAAAGIATPLAFAHAPDIERWVVKPDDGAGALATRAHRDAESAWNDWASRSRAGESVVIEPWVEGDALSLSLLCSAQRCELLSINCQQLDIGKDGLLSFRGVEVNAVPLTDQRAAPLAALAARVRRAIPGLRGFVGIDLVWHELRGPVVIEVNPRVTCAYVGLSRALGRNLAADVIAISEPKAVHGHA